jgi:hypothetical protein
VAKIRGAIALLLLAALSFLAACSSSSSKSVTQSSVSIALNPPPASSSVFVGGSLTFTPVVSNDPTTAGVDWAISCPLSSSGVQGLGPCGTLSIAPTLHSASGTAVTYVPPTYFPSGSMTVNVVAFATADHTQNVLTPVTVNSYTSALKGTYVLQVQGIDSNTQPFQATGALVFDGSGNITAAEETYNTVAGFSSPLTLQGSSGTPSTYFVGSDGRGTINLNVQQVNNSANTLTQNFSFVVLSSAKALVADLGDSSSTFAATGVSGTGTLELQDATAAAATLSGAYAFVTVGTDSAGASTPQPGTPSPTAIGGVINIDNNPGTGNISGVGSLADQDYYNSKGTRRTLLSCAPPTGLSGIVTPPDSLGAVLFLLVGATCLGTPTPASIQITGYIVDATHIRLIESDDVSGNGGFLIAGLAVGQGSAAGTFTNASLSGSYVFGVPGIDLISGLPSSYTSAGALNADGNGNVVGITDAFYQGAGAAFAETTIHGTYSVDSSMIGRADVGLIYRAPIPVPHPHFLLYMTGDGAPLVLYADGSDANLPAVGAGTTYVQSGSLAFGNPENYGATFTQQNGSENDGTGTMTTTATGNVGSLAGTVDDFLNNNFAGASGTPLPLLDSFSLPADSFGRIGGTFLNSSGTPGPYAEYYLADQNDGVFVETDLLNSGQVAFGSFAQACDVTSTTSCQAAAAAAKRSSVKLFRANSSPRVRDDSDRLGKPTERNQ